MKHFRHLASNLHVEPLRVALHARPDLFGRHTARAAAYGSPHQQMTDIWVRYNHIDNLGPGFADEHDSVWYPAYAELPELRPLVFGLMAFVQGERLGGVLITKLPPGGQILPHVDRGWHAEYYEKFTIAIQSAPGALFRFPDGDIAAQGGDLHWFDNSVPHSVTNDSDQDRIAMIVCIKTEQFPRSAR